MTVLNRILSNLLLVGVVAAAAVTLGLVWDFLTVAAVRYVLRDRIEENLPCWRAPTLVVRGEDGVAEAWPTSEDTHLRNEAGSCRR